ncbi:hypothetical protein [Geomicrobium sp. JCM 19038]|uniref:hypothetical protein n=1 Tax=Geomicrobium sp. JCM 19038 TaxID=1460635 RepID=UPI00045F11EC|nr:hypothetical protein [Geomicrobium sp. JCM 19038]GAK08179.1 hypothetical protein JCM19038_1954 [Geomicrobium sp. JCM 19038]
MQKRPKHLFFLTFAAPLSFIVMVGSILLLANPIPPIVIFGTLTLLYLLLGVYHYNRNKKGIDKKRSQRGDVQ